MKRLILLIATILLGSVAFAQTAYWVEIPLQYTWDRLESGFCNESTQCLVDPGGNPSFDGQPEQWFQSGGLESLMPRCINNTQYILDRYCENGVWSSRTKILALNLIEIVKNSNSLNNFTLFCAPYSKALNAFDYFVGEANVLTYIALPPCTVGTMQVPCVNNFCTLRWSEGKAFALTMNVPLSDPQSFLNALGLPPTACENVGEGNFFMNCQASIAQGVLKYHPQLQALGVFPPVVEISSPPNLQENFNSFMAPHISAIKGYVSEFNAPNQGPAFNISFFNYIEHLNNLYLASKGNDTAFSFFENEKFSKHGSIPVPIEFLGARYLNIDFSTQDPCSYYIKLRDPQAFCENQEFPNQAFMIGARRLIPNVYFPYNNSFLIFAWNDLTGKLRLGGSE